MKHPNPELIDDDTPEWTAADFARAKPASEVLDPALYAGLMAMKKGGRPKSASPKVSVTVRYSAEVLEWFKSKGDGWQTRMDEVLKAYVAQQQDQQRAA